MPDLVVEMAIEGIPETEDLAGFLLSTLGRGIAKLVDEVRMEEIAGICRITGR